MTTDSQTAGLQGKVAVVTGGSRGIGRAIAQALSHAGAAVLITGRDMRHLDDTVATLSGLGAGPVRGLRADVRDPQQAAGAIAAAVEQFGGLDILVNNAGFFASAPVADMTIEQFQQVIETNLSGVFYCCHAAVPVLRARGGGWVINISSLAGKNSFVGGAAYCASKAGLNAFSESLMQEVRYDNIRVSYVMPGSVSTEFSGQAGGADWKLAAGDVAQVVMDLVGHPARSLPSRVELRPSRPSK